MQNKLLKKALSTVSTELSHRDTMDDYLDDLLPEMKPWSEDLLETEFYLKKPFLEIRDVDDFHETILHIFNPDDEYLYSIDGNVTKGKWKILEKTNKLMIEKKQGDKVVITELYDLSFLNNHFLILKKHGDQTRLGQKKYLALGFEPLVKKLEWRDFVELLHEDFLGQNKFVKALMALIVLLILLAIFFSLR